MNKKKIFSYNTVLYKITGVQKVMMDIHYAMSDEYESYVVGNVSYQNVDKNLGLSKSEYKRWVNPFLFRNSVVFIHERKALLIFWFLNFFLFQNIKLVYVHHNIMYGYKWAPMPKCVIAISDRCSENLTDYFGVKPQLIHKIFNCVKDIHPNEHKLPSGDKIKILLPARINEQKQQLEIVKNLNGKLVHNVEILFAGTGPYYNQLEQLVKEDKNFRVLGFRSDIHQLLQECDYMMLFSKHEGLPITLIEATMCGTPIICNDVGGNLEIAHNNENAYVTDSWGELASIINSLPEVTQDEYSRRSKNSRKIYEQYFTFTNFKKQYLDLVSKILNY